MNLVYPVIRATAFASPIARVILVTAASGFLLAAGNVSDSRPSAATTMATITDPAPELLSNGGAVAETPADIAAQPKSLAALVSSIDDADTAVARDRDMHCLATAVYFESRGEPLEGQLAVAQAILNRVDSGRYADSACGVINQPGQFSFSRSRSPQAGEAWTTAKAIAVIAARELWKDMAPDAMSFHASYVAPNWHGTSRVVRIGRHIFYR